MADKHFEGSIESYRKALEIYEALDDTQGKAIAHTRLGSVYAATIPVWSEAPSTPPTIRIPIPPKPPQNSDGIRPENFKTLIDAYSQAIEFSQAGNDLSTTALLLMKLGEVQALQAVDLVTKAKAEEG